MDQKNIRIDRFYVAMALKTTIFVAQSLLKIFNFENKRHVGKRITNVILPIIKNSMKKLKFQY